MSLNVKDPEAHRLAQATGETMTRAVTEALRERYGRLQRRDPEMLATDIRAIAKRAAAHIKRPYLDHRSVRRGMGQKHEGPIRSLAQGTRIEPW